MLVGIVLVNGNVAGDNSNIWGTICGAMIGELVKIKESTKV